MTPNEIVTHPDFKNLVYAVVKKYGLLNKTRKSMDEYMQDVAAHMIIYGVSSKVKMSTNVYKHCVWVAFPKKRRKPKFPALIKKDSYLHDFSRLEKKEIYDQRVSVLTKREKEFVDLKLTGYNNMEIAGKFDCTHQNVACVVSTAKKRMINDIAKREEGNLNDPIKRTSCSNN